MPDKSQHSISATPYSPIRLYKHDIFKNVVSKNISTNRFASELNVDLKLCYAEMSYLCLHTCAFDFEGDAPASKSM